MSNNHKMAVEHGQNRCTYQKKASCYFQSWVPYEKLAKQDSFF